MELRNLRKVLPFIRNFFYKQYQKIVNISVKRLQSAVSRRTIFFRELFCKSITFHGVP